MEKMKRIKKRLSLTLRTSHSIDESLSELAEQMTIEDGGTKDNGENKVHLATLVIISTASLIILCLRCQI